MEDPFLFKLLYHLAGKLDLLSHNSDKFLVFAKIKHSSSDQETQISITLTKKIYLQCAQILKTVNCGIKNSTTMCHQCAHCLFSSKHLLCRTHKNHQTGVLWTKKNVEYFKLKTAHSFKSFNNFW